MHREVYMYICICISLLYDAHTMHTLYDAHTCVHRKAMIYMYMHIIANAEAPDMVYAHLTCLNVLLCIFTSECRGMYVCLNVLLCVCTSECHGMYVCLHVLLCMCTSERFGMSEYARMSCYVCVCLNAMYLQEMNI